MSNKNQATSNSNSSNNDCKPDNYHVNAKICRLVEQYPCMYDRSHVYYMKKDVVDQAWVKIAEEMNDSISSCKERWRNIRTSYARSINVNKVPASANRTKPYYLHKELQFLSYHITPGIPITRRSAPTSIIACAYESTLVSESKSNVISNSSNTFQGFGENDMKSENINEVFHEESFDSYAPTLQNVDIENNNDKNNDNNDNGQNNADNNIVNEKLSKKNCIQSNQKSNEESHPFNAQYTATTAPVIYPTVTVQQEPEEESQDQEKEQHQQQQKTLILCDIPNENDDEDDDDHDVIDSMDNGESNNMGKTFNYACAPPKKRLRIKDNSSNSSTDSLINDVKPLVVWPKANDFDIIFLQGLLPEIKAMNFHQKILFKRRVYEILTSIFENQGASSILSATTVTSTTLTTTTEPTVSLSMNNSTESATTTEACRINNKSKRKINQQRTSAAASMQCVDKTDSNMLMNCEDNMLQSISSPSTNISSSPNTKPTAANTKMSKQFHKSLTTEHSTLPIISHNRKSNIAMATTAITSSSKVGAITRSCTNSKRLRSSNVFGENQQHQTIKQEFDKNDERHIVQM